MNWRQQLSWLLANGVSQGDIARAANVKQPTIWAVVHGVTKHPRHDIVDAIRALHAERSAKAAKAGVA